MGREECGGVFLILIGYTALSIERIAKKFPGSIDGFILINPAWYAPLITLEKENVPKDIPILVLAGGKDLLLKPVEFEKWKEAVAKMPNVETVFYDQCDHIMVGCKHNPIPQEYAIFERHVSDVPLRKMAQFIRQIYCKVNGKVLLKLDLFEERRLVEARCWCRNGVPRQEVRCLQLVSALGHVPVQADSIKGLQGAVEQYRNGNNERYLPFRRFLPFQRRAPVS